MPKKNEPAENKLLAKMSKTSIAYKLLEPEDKIIVALSGGKDSWALVYLLSKLQKRLPFSITLKAIHVDLGVNTIDSKAMECLLKQMEIPFEVVKENIAPMIHESAQKKNNPCSLCSRMRRGILYTKAGKENFNKIALGHHLEDTLSTLLLNLFFKGRLEAMPPAYTTDNGKFNVIRPLIEITEEQLIKLTLKEKFPIQKGCVYLDQMISKREEMNTLLKKLEKTNPQVKKTMLAAMKNIAPSHLFDLTVKRQKT